MAKDPPTDEEVGVFAAQFCLVLGLAIPVLSYFCLRPNVNNAEKEFLRGLAWREFGIVVVYPWIALLALGALQLVPFPMFWILAYLKYFTIFYYHGFLPLLGQRKTGRLEGGMRYALICKTVLFAYFILSLSLIFVFFGLFGLVQFDLGGIDDEDSSGDPPQDTAGFPMAHYKVNHYGALQRVKMVPAPGFQKLSQSRSSETALLVVHFWVWQQLTFAAFRWRTYLWFFLSEVIDKCVEFVENEYGYTD